MLIKDPQYGYVSICMDIWSFFAYFEILAKQYIPLNIVYKAVRILRIQNTACGIMCIFRSQQELMKCEHDVI